MLFIYPRPTISTSTTILSSQSYSRLPSQLELFSMHEVQCLVKKNRFFKPIPFVLLKPNNIFKSVTRETFFCDVVAARLRLRRKFYQVSITWRGLYQNVFICPRCSYFSQSIWCLIPQQSHNKWQTNHRVEETNGWRVYRGLHNSVNNMIFFPGVMWPWWPKKANQ